jgi:hypothetical protein
MSNSDPKARNRPGPWPPVPESSPMPPSSWAKRTGFKPKFSGETNASGDSGQIITRTPPPPSQPRPKEPEPQAQPQPDLEAGRTRTVPPALNGEAEKDQTVKKRRDSDGLPKSSGQNGQAHATLAGSTDHAPHPARRHTRSEEAVDVLPQSVNDDDGFMGRPTHMKYELRDTPGLGQFLILIFLEFSFGVFISFLIVLILDIFRVKEVIFLKNLMDNSKWVIFYWTDGYFV